MNYFIDFAYGSLNKYQEELCGDKVEFYSDDNVFVLAFADGLGSGVKANILATLTSKIGVTMLKENMKLEDVVETISNTLPISPTLHIAYSTFTLIKVDKEGMAYIAEFENPSVIFIRNNEILQLDWTERIVYDKKIRETSIQLQHWDNLILLSDGYKFAGKDSCKKPWTYDDTIKYIKKCYVKEKNAKDMTNNLLDLFEALYYFEPVDDTSVATINVIRDKKVVLLSGPPVDRKRDKEIITKFMKLNGQKVICGGTTAKVVARVLNRKFEVEEKLNHKVPPIGHIEGIELVTEGVLTLQETTEILRQILNSTEYNELLNQDNGASKLAKLLYEDALHIKLMIGKSVNKANQILELSNQLTSRIDVLKELEEILIKLGKIVEVEYF